MAQVFLGLGSNLGNKKNNIANAIKEIALLTNTTVIQKSKLYNTKPEGHLDQPDFINAAIEIETKLSPQKLLAELQQIEIKLGREKTFKGGPRIIDIDILTYDNLEISTPELTIPHPEMNKRNFVLKPLSEII